jgi:hypothetical protein
MNTRKQVFWNFLTSWLIIAVGRNISTTKLARFHIGFASVLDENPVLFASYILHGLQVQVSIGEKMLVGLATGTAAFLTPLPMPPIPKVSAGNSWADDKKLAEIQKLLQDTVKKNRDIYQLKPLIVSGGLVVYNLIHIYESTFILLGKLCVIFLNCIWGL